MVAICPNPFRDIDLKYTRMCKDILSGVGIESIECPVFDDDRSLIPDDIEIYDLKNVAADIDCAIVIGGDGTILNVSSDIYKLDIPVLGLNLGTKGFMACLEPENIEYIAKLQTGDYKISRRMMLDVALERNGEIIYTGTALNDAVIHGYGDTIVLEATCDGTVIFEFAGDGIIVSTPTGSTGYSVSAGGPIVEPDTESIIVSPICAHSLGARSFVLDASRNIRVKVSRLHDRRAYLSVDGNSVLDLANDDIVCVHRSEHSIKMINFGIKSFFETAFEKLS